MTMPRPTRRSLLRYSLGAAAAAALGPGRAWAQAYPAKPITLVSPFAPGGADTLLRLMLPSMQELLGQPLVIENLPGAGGLIGSERVARSAPDGYTLLFAPSSASVTAPLLYRQAKVDTLRDFVPILGTNDTPQVLVVHPSLPVKTVADLIALDKAKPNSLSYGSAGHGSVMQLNGELFNAAAHTHLLHVPFGGIGAMLTDTLAGRIPVGFTTITQTHGYIAAGKLKALAILDDKPSPFLPGVPSINDALPTFRQSDTWACILAPTGTPQAVQDTLFKAFKTTLERSDVKQNFTEHFAYVKVQTSAETTQRLKSDIERTRQLMKVARIEQL